VELVQCDCQDRELEKQDCFDRCLLKPPQHSLIVNALEE
jgi:hypothetical protein